MMMDGSASEGSGSGDPHQGGSGASSNPQGQKKMRSHRHTTQQIQRLEFMFKDCPHPDERTRLQLSRELDMTPEQVKFWFQNRRTQLKVQHDRADNFAIQEENDRIRFENIAIKDAMKNVLCHSCGGPPLGLDEQKLLMENAQLKEELARLTRIAAKYLGSQLAPEHPIPMPSPEQPIPMPAPEQPIPMPWPEQPIPMPWPEQPIPMPAPEQPIPFPSPEQPIPMPWPEQPIPMPSANLLQGSSSTSVVNPISGGGTMNISDMVKSPMADVRFKVAGNAMDELIALIQCNEPLWVKSPVDGRDVLNVEAYDVMFPGPRLKNPNTRTESSRGSTLVMMNSLALVDMFMDVNKWVEVFPNIVSSARTLEVISSGKMGSHSGKLQLMYEELQVLSPFVPPRKLYFLRFCQQIRPTCWAIVDVSVEAPPENQIAASSTSCKTYKFPSGCLIQEVATFGHSRVVWLEHLEIEQTDGVHVLFGELFHNGMAYSAERWLGSLHRMCDRYFCHAINGGIHPPPEEGALPAPSPEGKRSIMKLAQRLVTSFCASINPSDEHQWTALSGLMNGYDVKATLQGSTHSAYPDVMALTAATTIWLPAPPQHVFDFLRDASTRPQWDVFFTQVKPVEQAVRIANGTNFGNCISVLREIDTSQNSEKLILQESCVDTSGAMVVFGPVDTASISLALRGEDTSNIYLLPSGFAILPDGCNWNTGSGQGASSSSGGITGSLLTVVIQICLGILPSAKLSPEMENTARNLIATTVDLIKDAFNCTTTSSP